MNRRKQIYEGKAKVLFQGPEPGTIVQYFKDDATAFNNEKKGTIAGKGVLNNRISELLMVRLQGIGIPTHFIKRLNMREHRRRQAPAALDRRVLPEKRRIGRSNGVRRTHHCLRLGDPSGIG